MKNRFLIFVFAVILAVASCQKAIVCAVDSEPEIAIVSVDIDTGGAFEVIGRVEGAQVGTQVSFLMCPAVAWDSTGHIKESSFKPEYIAYIDQVSTGNNGAFIVQGQLDEKWKNQTLRFAGASSSGGYYTQTMSIPEIPHDIGIIEDNSVIYGRDAYLITGAFYTADNISKSIKEGGNRIYYKLGGRWYDLLDPEALDNSFLVSANAINDSDVEQCKPRYYYNDAKKIELNYT